MFANLTMMFYCRKRKRNKTSDMTNRKFTRLVGKNQLNTHLISAHLQINGKLRSSTIYIGAIRHQLN